MQKDVLNFFYKKGLPPLRRLQSMITEPLRDSGDFGEIYVEDTASRYFILKERIISDISSSFACGAGIRVIRGNKTGYSYSENLEENSIQRCIANSSRIAGAGITLSIPGPARNLNLYPEPPSVHESAAPRIDILRRAEAKAFALSPLVEKVEASISETFTRVLILNSLGVVAADIRPMVRFSIMVILNKNGAREVGSEGGGGRRGFSWFTEHTPESMAEAAVNQALTLLDARPAPAGEMEVVLGSGESGILLHESIGHPLEADFNYRGSSAFSGRIGQKVASDQCTIIDQGDIPNQRGSLNADDEGNPTGRGILIENGVLRDYMYDLITANHFKRPAHNGRRESFREIPMPRMTNTFMLGGKYKPEEIISSVQKGVYAKSFSGGQVDISSGDFVFSVTEGYLVENGKIKHPIKGATLIGNGPEILKRVEMVGDDFVISDGKWTCGKEGQSVPVGVGIPTVKLSHITVGGTQND